MILGEINVNGDFHAITHGQVQGTDFDVAQVQRLLDGVGVPVGVSHVLVSVSIFAISVIPTKVSVRKWERGLTRNELQSPRSEGFVE
jgi:hypothetical protein